MPQQAFWRGLLEGFFQLVSVFIDASQNFIFYFLHNKAAKNLKTIGTYTESTDLIFKTFKKIFISWHNPFKRVKDFQNK
jgi:hypothetical protein